MEYKVNYVKTLCGTTPLDWVSTSPVTVNEAFEADIVISAIEEVTEYHQSTLKDKYDDSTLSPLELIMSGTHGKSINVFNAIKYLSRYITTGHDKSDNRKDVIKAVHYLLFELARTR